MESVTRRNYGIMAVIHIPGVSPECDETHFDGWYSDLSDAKEIFDLFKKRYPEADVFIVTREAAEWRQLDVPFRATVPAYEDLIERNFALAPH